MPYPLFDLLLRTAEQDLYRPLWSTQILDEVHKNNVSKLGVPVENSTRRLAAMRAAFPDAMVSGHEPLIDVMTNDPKDRHVLAAAVRGNAGAIITANLKDFKEPALSPYEIRAIHPDDFLLDLLDLNEIRVRAAVQSMFESNANPPKSVSDLLRFCEGTTPNFAAAMLERG